MITTAVQALAGVLLPSASVFLLLLCNDHEVLGPWVNQRWLNAVAAAIIGILLVLSGILMTATLFPHLNVVRVAEYLTAAVLIGAAIALIAIRRSQRHRDTAPPPHLRRIGEADKMTWRMPQLALLQPVTWSAGTKLGMIALRGYLILGALLLIVKAIQLARG